METREVSQLLAYLAQSELTDRHRYLYLAESAPQTAVQHRPGEGVQADNTSFLSNVLPLCPRLILVALVRDHRNPDQLQLTLHRPMDLVTLLQVCNAWTSDVIGTDTISLFARYFSSISLGTETLSIHRNYFGRSKSSEHQGGGLCITPEGSAENDILAMAPTPTFCGTDWEHRHRGRSGCHRSQGDSRVTFR
jgi:hypothetical protein